MSKIKVILMQEDESFELHANSLKEVLSLLKLQKDEEYVSKLVTENYKYVLVNGEDYENMIALTPEIATSSFDGFDTLLILPEIEVEGEEPFMIAAVLILGTSASTGAVIATAAVLAIMASIAVSMAVSAIMSAISPTPEFGKDPSSQQQESNLFNSAPVVRNQGGSVPLIFGNPYCGAVLISSGLFSEEVTI
jgi:predicted phage tail protein